MKKIVCLSVVCASILLADTVVLEEIETISTATKTEKKIDGVAASVEVITEKEIQKMGAESLKDIMSNVPGINVQYGTFPSASSKSKASVTFRGMGAKGTLFLVDGRRLGGEVSNPYDLDRIAASQIERIEIVKGPMSTLYGADAAGGIINIITKKPTEKPEINFGIRYGQNGDGDDKNKNINLNAKGKKEKLGYSFYINKTDTDPYTQKETADVYIKQGGGKVKPAAAAGANLPLAALSSTYIHDVTYREDSDILTYGGRLEYEFSDKVTGGVEINYFDEERNGSYIGYFHPSNVSPAPGQKTPVYNLPVNSEDKNERLDIATDFKILATEDLMVELKAYKSYYEKRNTTTTPYWAELQYASEAASAQNGMNANVDIRSYELIANYFLNENHLLTAGVEYRDETREATVFQQANVMTEKAVDYKSVYLQDEWSIDDTLNVILGARYDSISNADSKTTLKVGAIKNFSKLYNLRANVAQGYRAPDIRELYIFKNTPAGANRGADVVDATVGKTTAYDLKPESTLTYELGLGGSFEKGRYDMALFYNDVEDMISEVNKGAYYTFENIPNAETYGLEFSLGYDLVKDIELGFNWMELRTKNDSTGKDLEFNPERTLSTSVTYQASDKLDTSLIVKHTGEQYYLKTLNKGTPTETTVDATTNSFTTVDWKINYDYSKSMSIYGGINNLFDKDVDDVLGSSSGRYFFTGINVKF